MSLDATLQIFFEEAADLLREYETELLRLEQDPHAHDALDAVFRTAHTLKGTSATLGFEAIARFTHALEDLLARLRKGELAVTPDHHGPARVGRRPPLARRAGAQRTPVDATELDAMIGTLRARVRDGGAPAPRGHPARRPRPRPM